MENCYKTEEKSYCQKQTHVHELLGSVKIAEKDDPHNHRFASVSEQAIKVPGGHIHKIYVNTDNYEDHHHEICIKTGTQIPVCEGRHIHFAEGCTSVNDCHQHEFILATLIDNPIGD